MEKVRLSLRDIAKMFENKVESEAEFAGLTLCSDFKDSEGFLNDVLECPEINIGALVSSFSKKVAMNAFGNFVEEFIEKVEKGEFEGMEVREIESEPEEFQA